MNRIRLATVSTLFALLVNCLPLPSPVSASGDTSYTYTIHDNKFWSSPGVGTMEWHDLVPKNDVVPSSGITVGFSSYTDGKWQGLQRACFGFNVGVPASGTRKTAKVRLYASSRTNSLPWSGADTYLALFRGSPGLDHSIDTADSDNAWVAGSVMVSPPVAYDSIATGEYHDFTIPSSDWDYLVPDANGYVWFYLMTWAEARTPIGAADNSAQPQNDSLNKVFQIMFQKLGDANPPLLVETYEPVINTPVTYEPSNAAVDANVTALKQVTSVTWLSPRCAYANEKLSWDVGGESGAAFTAQVKDQAGVVLATISDSVRVDGHYYALWDPPDTTDKFVRFEDGTHSKNSLWGYVAPSPGVQSGNTINAVDTQPELRYRYPFSRYKVGELDRMFYHFKTNIADNAGERDSHTFRIYQNGEAGTVLLSENFTNLNDVYYMASVNNTDMLQWRYLIASPYSGSGVSTYDGLVWALNVVPTAGNYGWLLGTIYNSSTELTLPLSAYWYLPASDGGVATAVDKAKYAIGEAPQFTVGGSADTHLSDRLYHANVAVYNSSGNLTGSGSGTIAGGSATFPLPAVAVGGTYTGRMSLSAAGTSFVYWKYFDYTVGTAAAGASTGDTPIDVMLDWMSEHHWDNPGGKILALLIACIVVFAITYKSKFLRVVLPLVVIALAIVTGWLDLWVSVLLALVAGGSVWAMVRNKMAGKGAG